MLIYLFNRSTWSCFVNLGVVASFGEYGYNCKKSNVASKFTNIASDNEITVDACYRIRKLNF